MASEYEDKIDCFGHYHCFDSDNSVIHLSWLQMLISVEFHWNAILAAKLTRLSGLKCVVLLLMIHLADLSLCGVFLG